MNRHKQDLSGMLACGNLSMCLLLSPIALDPDLPARPLNPSEVAPLPSRDARLTPEELDDVQELRRISTGDPPVGSWLEHFYSGAGRPHLERGLGRHPCYQAAIESELKQAGLPLALQYLPILESGLIPQATSLSGAGGPWQLMPETAIELGLRVDAWVDERRDPVLSTRAAAKHLAALWRQFRDWELVLTAYNAGAAGVADALRRSGARTFQELSRSGLLSDQARNFVPKFQAILMLALDTTFARSKVPDDPPETVTILLKEDFGLGVLAAAAGVTPAEFLAQNPALGHWGTPPSGYPVKIPKGRAPMFRGQLQAVPMDKRLDYRVHVVKPGDTLLDICRRHGAPIGPVIETNELTTRGFTEGMQLFITTPPP